MKYFLSLVIFFTLVILPLNSQAQVEGRCIKVDENQNITILSNITNRTNCLTANGIWELQNGSCIDDSGNKIESIKYRGDCKNKGVWSSDYSFLAPITEEEKFNPAEKNALSKYLNLIIKIVIGIAAVLSVIMIVMGGIQYMTSELISSKEEGKKRITNAIFGLLIALGSYLILFTINPNLLDVEPDVNTASMSYIEIDAPEGGDIFELLPTSSPPQTTTGGTSNCSEAGKAFCMFGNYSNPLPTGQVPQLISLLKSDPGYKITKIDVYTNDRIWFTAEKGSDKKMFSTTGFGHGRNGFSEMGQGREGDLKTPKGSFTISWKRKVDNQMEVIRSIPKGFSMGAASFNLNSRGIAIHGNTKNGPGTSAACILMSNDDLLALYPYIYSGLTINIR